MINPCAAESNMNTNSSMQTVDNECIMKRNRRSPYAKYVSNSNELSDKIETLSKENEILLKSNRYYRNKKQRPMDLKLRVRL